MAPYLQHFEVVGKGKNLRASDGAIVAEAGWDTEGILEGAVLLKVGNKLKVRFAYVKNQIKPLSSIEECYAETNWTVPGNRLNEKPISESNRVTHISRVFQQLSEVVFESNEPILPHSQQRGESNSYPFTFKLPKNKMPSSFESNSGSIQYYIKCTMLYQEGMKLLKSSIDFEVPVIILMPEAAKLKLLQAPSRMTYDSSSPPDGAAAAVDKVQFEVEIPKRILVVGDIVDVSFTLKSLPENTRLRMINASLRTVAQYLNSDGVGAIAKFPRPLSEASENFPLVYLNEPLVRKLQLTIDKEMAHASFESTLISIKTVFRLEIVLSDSETPNVSYEIPIVVIPTLEEAQPQINDGQEQYFQQQQRQTLDYEQQYQYSQQAPFVQPDYSNYANGSSGINGNNGQSNNYQTSLSNYQQQLQTRTNSVVSGSIYSRGDSESTMSITIPTRNESSADVARGFQRVPVPPQQQQQYQQQQQQYQQYQQYQQQQLQQQQQQQQQQYYQQQPQHQVPILPPVVVRQQSVGSAMYKRPSRPEAPERSRSLSKAALAAESLAAAATTSSTSPRLPPYEEFTMLSTPSATTTSSSVPPLSTASSTAMDTKITDLLAEIEALELAVAEKADHISGGSDAGSLNGTGGGGGAAAIGGGAMRGVGNLLFQTPRGASPAILPADSVSVRSAGASSAMGGTTNGSVSVPNQNWGVVEVCEWVKSLGCTVDVLDAFKAEEIDGNILLTLTDGDLKNELKIMSL
ncbi:hypothetical protein HK100_003711, partial [Physocladia obscura]